MPHSHTLLSPYLRTVACIAIILMFWQQTHAQVDAKKLHLIARPTPDSIVLRWAPSSYEHWKMGNTYGYMLMRYTVARDSVILTQVEEKLLTPQALKPLPLYDWEPLVKTNIYAAVVAQALYGESFETETSLNTNPEYVANKAQEQDMRFGLALHAADMSAAAAQASGLRFVDTQAKPNEQYVYRLYYMLPDSVQHANDTAFIFIGISDYVPLPAPVGLTVNVQDNAALLSWNSKLYEHIYVAWEVQRRQVGKKFQSIRSTPIVPSHTPNAAPSYLTYIVDTIPNSTKIYEYRLRAVSAFGEWGPWSDVVKTDIHTHSFATPHIAGYEERKESVKLTWEFPKDDEMHIAGFIIERAQTNAGTYTPISTLLKPNIRSYTDPTPMHNNYYKVKAIAADGTHKESYSLYVHITDTQPPHTPLGLTANVDSLGVVALSWLQNTDDDIEGYRVFKSASGKDEFSLQTHHTITDTVFYDSIHPQDLNAALYYKIIAIDKNQNQSEFSEIYVVKKPDNIPPAAPVIARTIAKEGAIELQCIASASTDVESYILMRAAHDSSTWQHIATLHTTRIAQPYTDTTVLTATNYRYKLIAIDSANNRSQAAYSVVAAALPAPAALSPQPIVRVAKNNAEVQCTWHAPTAKLQTIHVYKKTNANAFELYDTIAGTAQQYTDADIRIGNTYSYFFKFIYTHTIWTSTHYTIEF